MLVSKLNILGYYADFFVQSESSSFVCHALLSPIVDVYITNRYQRGFHQDGYIDDPLMNSSDGILPLILEILIIIQPSKPTSLT